MVGKWGRMVTGFYAGPNVKRRFLIRERATTVPDKEGRVAVQPEEGAMTQGRWAA